MPDIRCPLEHAASDFGDKTAIISDKGTITYEKYHQFVASAAEMLRQKGVQSGNRVAILSDNCIEYPILLMALFRLKVVACPINVRWPIEMISSYMTRIGCSHLIAEEQSMHTAFQLRSEQLSARKSLNVQALDSIVILETESDTTKSNITLNTNQNSTIIATSGSSATPRAVMHSFGNHYYNALGSNTNIHLDFSDRWLMTLPIYHVGGLAILFKTILANAAIVFPVRNSNIANEIERHNVSHCSLVPTQLHRLMRYRTGLETARQMKAILIGGGAVSKDLISKAVNNGLPMHTTYGLTEMASQVTTSKTEDSLAELLTSGKLLPHRKLSISNNGEILVKGNTLFRGYVDGDNITLPLDGNGWFHTGDLGTLDNDGYLTVLGRKDNMFVSGGENIHPELIESALLSIEDIEEAIVVKISDVDFGHRPAAFVKLLPDIKLNTKKLKERLRLHLPGYMLPTVIYPWPEEANKNSIKPNRQYLTALAEKMHSTPST